MASLQILSPLKDLVMVEAIEPLYPSKISLAFHCGGNFQANLEENLEGSQEMGLQSSAHNMFDAMPEPIIHSFPAASTATDEVHSNTLTLFDDSSHFQPLEALEIRGDNDHLNNFVSLVINSLDFEQLRNGEYMHSRGFDPLALELKDEQESLDHYQGVPGENNSGWKGLVLSLVEIAPIFLIAFEFLASILAEWTVFLGFPHIFMAVGITTQSVFHFKVFDRGKLTVYMLLFLDIIIVLSLNSAKGDIQIAWSYLFCCSCSRPFIVPSALVFVVWTIFVGWLLADICSSYNTSWGILLG